MKDEKLSNSFLDSVRELIATYNDTYPLLGVDFSDTLSNTRKFSFTEKQSKENILSFISGAEGRLFRLRLPSGRGGYISIFLFKRRIKKMFSAILTTCYLFINYEKDKEQTRIALEVIKLIKKNEKIASRKMDKSVTIDFALRLTPIIISIIASSVITGYFIQLFKPLLTSCCTYKDR